jgi:RNA polymerase sigma-70 factor (ECF subfamily)
MRDITFTEVERLHTTADADEAFQMDEETFRGFYDRTARSVWSYLSHLTGDAQLADDLLQETYYRFLRANRTFATEAHRRNYLFRIATNLVRDGHRRHRLEIVQASEPAVVDHVKAGGDVANLTMVRADLGRAMARLTARDREMLWLAYAQGSSHEEIAESLGLKTASIKALLFRARRRLAQLLRGRSGETSSKGTTR